MRGIHRSAWFLAVLSALLQILLFPLPNYYVLGWIAIAPLLVALLRARVPSNTLQFPESIKLLPARPLQGFVLGYVNGILWYAGSCYWIFSVMHEHGGVSIPLAVVIQILFCLYLALYHGVFGLLISLLTGKDSFSRRALLLAPVTWVAVELARTRITGFPWDLLGISQVDNIPLARIATATGVYGLSFEIMVVNVAFAAGFLLRRNQRKAVLLAATGAAIVLQAGRWIPAPPLAGDHAAVLVQTNIPILEGSAWTKGYFNATLNDLADISFNAVNTAKGARPDLIAWPENPAPFYTLDPFFRNVVSATAQKTDAWMLVGSVGIENASAGSAQRFYNSAALISPAGDWAGRYDKIHLVPFGEYVPFEKLFAFASGLTQEVGNFTSGSERIPLTADGKKLGVFICYESIFPDDIRQLALNGAQVFVNISNDGWYGDSGAYAQHLKQARMRAVENARWLLRDTNTGVTAAIDPYGRVVASIPRKTRSALIAPYALSDSITIYTRYGDWFAYLCAIISLIGLIASYAAKPEHRAKVKSRNG